MPVVSHTEPNVSPPTGVGAIGGALLDSSLITPTILELYNLKIVKCGDYIQYYLQEDKKKKPINFLKDNTDLYLIQMDRYNTENTSITANQSNGLKDEKIIEKKNIIRSKLECQRLAKCNANDWCTFITLTFADNVTDISYANKRIRYFFDKVRRVYKDFKCIYIPEFQKRGAVHYHLLTNISIDNRDLIYEQEDNKNFLHVKYWKDGFTSVEIIKGDIKKIIGYISKYMTKDIDNRLFGYRRYSYTHNLKKPIVEYLNLDNIKDLSYFDKLIKDKSIIYHNNYKNPYNDEKIEFLEFL